MEAIKKYTDLKISMKKQQTINTKVDNGVRQSRLRLRAFVSVGEAFLFLFEASNVHHKSANGLQNELVVFF
jgi:hypothetical protein